MMWQDPANQQTYHINIVDTPGHADFGGEVERVLSMVDGVALVVDATDGPMTQTKFVLSKALKMGLKPIVVINKVDRPTARVGEVENEIFDLFVNLSASDAQMEFPMVYACARDGWSSMEPKTVGTNMNALFQTIVGHMQPPQLDRAKPFSMAVTQIESDQFLGKLLLGRIQSGKVTVGDRLVGIDGATGNKVEDVKCMKIIARRGLEQVQVPHASAGDIVSLAGFSISSVNSTLADPSVTEALPFTPVDPPTLAMSFSVNTSPFAGQEGSQLTSSMIKERLAKEAETNVSMQIVESENKEAFEVRGRGELQLGVLIETMRREGYEISVSAPRVVLKRDDETGEMLEPLEEVVIDVGQENTGQVIEKMSSRKGELQDFVQGDDGKARLKFKIPMRGLIGYRSELQNDTRGQGIMNNIFHSYVPFMGDIDKSDKGALISSAEGTITSFALEGLEARGTLFVEPGMKTYSGMVIGEHNREENLEVNPVKQKALSNVRSVTKEEKVKLTPPRMMSLEEVIAYVRDDECIEVTGKSIRLRKIELDGNKRKSLEKGRANRRKSDAGKL
jgi:GTP-binding protein